MWVVISIKDVVNRKNVVRYALISPLLEEEVRRIMGRFMFCVNVGPVFLYQSRSFR